MKPFWWKYSDGPNQNLYPPFELSPSKSQSETLHLTALFGVEMFQRTARIVADSYSSRPLLLSLWMSAGPSESEWPEGSTDPPAQFWRTFVSKSRFSQTPSSSISYPQKTKLNFMANCSPIANSYNLRFVKTNFCA